MAKWGEGDPRWIVEERADATNVNNWHWTEKNATSWSKDRLKSLLVGLTINNACGNVELQDFVTLEGEASANNRKSKLIFFYEWDIKINWKGNLNTEDMTEVKGTISIPNLSDEQDIVDIEVNVALTSQVNGGDILKEMIRTKGADLIREKLADYIDSLKIEFSQGMILPTDPQASTNSKSAPTSSAKSITEEFKQASIAPASTNTSKLNQPVIGVKLDTKKISMKEEFMCGKEELYRALTEKNMVQAFTRAPVGKWELCVGGRFILFDGLISGEFQQLVPHETIVQRWRMKSWPSGHHSVVTIKLSQSSNSTTLVLSQTGVPASETESTKQGWRGYYWNSIRQTFGFGVNIF